MRLNRNFKEENMIRKSIFPVLVLIGAVLVGLFRSTDNTAQSQVLPILGISLFVLGVYFSIKPREERKQKSFCIFLIIIGVAGIITGVIFSNNIWLLYYTLASILFFSVGIVKLLPTDQNGASMPHL